MLSSSILPGHSAIFYLPMSCPVDFKFIFLNFVSIFSAGAYLLEHLPLYPTNEAHFLGVIIWVDTCFSHCFTHV